MKKSLLILPLIFLLGALDSGAQRTLPDPKALLRSGPMLGYSTLSETAIWVQTTAPTTAQIRYWKSGLPESARLSGVARTTSEGDLIARFVIPDLEFGTEYDYELYLDGRRIAFDFPLRFQTQPMWAWRTEPPAFTAAVGSCAYINEPIYDRPGTPYGSGDHIFRSIAAKKPDLMLWIGDNTYYREGDWESEISMRQRWMHTRQSPEMQPLLAATHNYAMWDDHDYGPNDSDRSYPMRETALRIFKDYWMNRTWGTPETPGVFSRFQWGDVEFFMLDDRYYRSPNRMPDTPEKKMWGDEQAQWLLEGLRSSRAPFKIILNGNQMLNPSGDEEILRRFPGDYARFFDFIRDAKVEGVVLISGDRHHAVLMREEREGMYPLYELTTSPLTAGLHEPREQLPLAVPGTLVTKSKNFALLDFSGPRTDRKLTIRLIDDKGTEVWRREILASELKFK
jgi:alkaline phosphatase D